MWDMEVGLPLGLTDLLTLDGSERLELEEPVDMPPDAEERAVVERVALCMAVRHWRCY